MVTWQEGGIVLPPDIEQEIAGIRGDQVSGATALVLRGIGVLRAAARDQAVLRDTSVALCRAQPSMAGFHTAAAVALDTASPLGALAVLESRIRRAPAAIARLAVPLIRLRARPGDPLQVVTCSRSAAVEATLLEAGRVEALRVSCSESLPGREGLALGERLAAAGIQVEMYTDAGLGAALGGADVLVTGADAVCPAGFINKVGTAGLAALARLHGIPVLVLAAREKVLPHAVFERLPLREAPVIELPWAAGRAVAKNPLFERVPAEVSADLVTDSGHLPLESCSEAGYWTPAMVGTYLSYIHSLNMLDRH